MYVSKFLKIAVVGCCYLVFNSVAQQYPVYQAQAGGGGVIPQQQPQPQPQPQGQAVFAQGQQAPGAVVAGSPTQPQQMPQPPQQGQVNAQGVAQGDIKPKETENKNPFLEYYSKQGSEFAAKVYYQNGKNLALEQISHDDLKKAVVVFFGEWCPHCDNFLKIFSKQLEFLRLYKVNVIFIHVPSIDRLKDYEKELSFKYTPDEFNQAENKISAYGINLSKKKTNVALLGDRVSLGKNGIEGLPVVIAIRDGKECFRAVGENTSAKLDFSNEEVLKNFLAIWDEDVNVVAEEKESAAANAETTKSSKHGKKAKKQEKSSKKEKKSKKKEKDETTTELPKLATEITSSPLEIVEIEPSHDGKTLAFTTGAPPNTMVMTTLG